MAVAVALAGEGGDSEGWLAAIERWNREQHHHHANAIEVSIMDARAVEKQRRSIATLQGEQEKLQHEQSRLLETLRRLEAKLEQIQKLRRGPADD